MEHDKILALLNSVKDGEISPNDALSHLRMEPFEDLGYVKIDHHRELRHGIPEVISARAKQPNRLRASPEKWPSVAIKTS